MVTAVLLLAQLTAADPRIELLDLQFSGQYEAALEKAESEIESRPRESREEGIDYLRAHLLHRIGRGRQAIEAFASAMVTNPRLALHSRYRLACNQDELGHPEVAAGLVATVVASGAAPDLMPEAVRLLTSTLRQGGDCRLLLGIDPSKLKTPERRYIEMANGGCALRGDDVARASAIFNRLLREKITDEPARLAAECIADRHPAMMKRDRDLAVQVGLTFHHHREFDRSLSLLGPVVDGFSNPFTRQEFDIGYARSRSLFWQERFDAAAETFGVLARGAQIPELRAKAFYQQARSYELAGRWRQGFESFRAAYRAEPDGEWADAALFSALRIKWRSGNEQEAVKIFDFLAAGRSWRKRTARAALFLASSDLVQGRGDRARRWLELADHGGRPTAIEVDYWRGRLEEIEGDLDAAVARYLAVLRRDRHHPMAAAARRRLAQPGLAPLTSALGDRLAATAGGTSLASTRKLYDAWLLLAPDGGDRQGLLERLLRRLVKDPGLAPYLLLSPVAMAEWPLWKSPLHRADELLLALGIWSESGRAVERHFPISQTSLAYTGGRLLAAAGEPERALTIAQNLMQRMPPRIPEVLLPVEFRKLLYPLAFEASLRREAGSHGVDPFLMAAVIREESRFDPKALSAASARGLTQFVQPTAGRIAARIGLGPITAEDVYRPPVAMALGAAYLDELLDRFRGATEVAVASYNAGEAQALLWRSYCYSSEPEEYFSKVGFLQTRTYLSRVLSSRSRYDELYGAVKVSTTGGSPEG